MMRNRRWTMLVAFLAAGVLFIFAMETWSQQLPVFVKFVPFKQGCFPNSGWTGLVDQPTNAVPASRGAALLGEDCAVVVPKSDEQSVSICDRNTGKLLGTWTWGPEWFFDDKMVPSQNGKFVMVCLNDGRTDKKDPAAELCRIGIITRKDGLRWVAPIAFARTGFGPTGMAVSGDGKVFGLSGIEVGKEVGVWSVQEEKALWRDIQREESGIDDIAFSPDDKTLYAVGTSGWTYAYEVASGKILKKWMASKSGKETYGYRATKVAASPDGKLVATGTGPDGDVFVWDVETGKSVAQFQTKGSTVGLLAFSPDSSMLAVCGAQSKAIEIWRIR